MCDQKFQLTVDKVTFVGHPSFSAGTAQVLEKLHVGPKKINYIWQGLLSSKSNFQFNIVFALPVSETYGHAGFIGCMHLFFRLMHPIA